MPSSDLNVSHLRIPMASSPSTLSPLLTIPLLVLLSTTPLLTSSLNLSKNNPPTHLHLYLHDIMSGPNSTKVTVAGPNATSPGFGDIIVYDIPLREGPEPESELVGRAQGSSTQASKEGPPAAMLAENFVFSGGEYEGSTLAMMGRFDLAAEGWEMAVVGGSGRFRLARGYALGRILTSDTGTGIRVMEYQVYVVPYEIYLSNQAS